MEQTENDEGFGWQSKPLKNKSPSRTEIECSRPLQESKTQNADDDDKEQREREAFAEAFPLRVANVIDLPAKKRVIVVTANVNDVCTAIEREPSTLRAVYMQNDRRGEIDFSTAPPRFKMFSRTSMVKRLLSRNIQFEKCKSGDDSPTECKLPDDIADAFMMSNEGSSELVAVTNFAIRRADGTWQFEGYDPQTKVFVQLEPTIATYLAKYLPENPTQDQAQKAAQWLKTDLFCDFPFKHDEAFSAFVAAMMTPLFRYGEPSSNAPFFLVTSPTPRIGKGRLIDIGAIVVAGAPAAPCTLSKSKEDESEKRVRSILKRGRPIVKLDNLPTGTAFGGSPFDELATGNGFYEGRELGTENLSTLRNLATWFVSGNSIELTEDAFGRTIRIELETTNPSPENRQDFNHPDIEAYALEKRAKALLYLIVMLKAADQARGRGELVSVGAFGGFESWQRTIAGALVYSGLRDPAKTLQRAVDTGQGAQDQAVVLAIEAFCASRNIQTTSASELLEKRTSEPESWATSRSELREVLSEIFERLDQTNAKSLGRYLAKLNGRWFPAGVRLVQERFQNSKNCARWHVEHK